MALTYEVEIEKHQSDFINDTSRLCLLSGGWGSGKTWANILKAIYYGLKYPGIEILVCAETFPLLQDTVYKEFMQICPRRLIKHDTKKPINVYFKNDSKFYFRSFDKEWKAKSFTVGAIFGEELTTFKEDTFKQLRARLRQKRPKGDKRPDFPRNFSSATNPAGLTHWVYKFFIDPDTKFKNAKVFNSTTFDNTYLPRDYTDDLRTLEKSNKAYYDRNVLGLWGQLEGLIYELPETQRYILERMEFDHYIAGLDFGFGHPTALSCIGVSSGRFAVVDEWYERKVTSSDIINKVKQYQKKYNFYNIYCDSARPEIIEEMVQAGLPAVPCIKGAGSVFAGIMNLKGLIGNNNLFLGKEAHYHLREVDSYIWDKSTDSKERPLKVNDDCMDAMRYAIYTYTLDDGGGVPIDDLYEFQKML